MKRRAPLLELRNVSCVRGDARLRDVSLSFSAGRSIIVTGDSGGALLARIAALQERPDSGEVWLADIPLHEASDEEFECVRKRVGIVFAAPHLLPGLSALENVAVPLFKLRGLDTPDAAERTRAALIFARLRGDPCADVLSLSRADQQRVALARAVVLDPLILATFEGERDLSTDEAAEFREVVQQASSELGVLAISLIRPVAGTCPADRTIVVNTGLALES